MEQYDMIIIGAGLYGLYSALFCAKRGRKVLVLECDAAPFQRATYINQARVHQGYHYPRSISTAVKSAGYFDRFNQDFGFCVNRQFDQIYATSGSFSWTDGKQFQEFCRAARIPCEELCPDNYFRHGMCDGAFRTREYTYDARILRDYFLEKLGELQEQVRIVYQVKIRAIRRSSRVYEVWTQEGGYCAGYLLNAAYAGTNQILALAGFAPFGIKYELCEIILCRPGEKLRKIGLTVMDGPFFSIKKKKKTGYHSLTSVTFTPHTTSYESLPSFPCQEKSGGFCSRLRLGNCNDCPAKPKSAFPYMAGLAKKYMREELEFSYSHSLYSMKPILVSSEIDDSRPTVIRTYSKNPTFVGVLSGKINTIYDLDEVLCDGE